MSKIFINRTCESCERPNTILNAIIKWNFVQEGSFCYDGKCLSIIDNETNTPLYLYLVFVQIA